MNPESPATVSIARHSVVAAVQPRCQHRAASERLGLAAISSHSATQHSSEQRVSMDINGISAVVTGAAPGLRDASARALAWRGANVPVFDRDETSGEQVAAEIGGVFCEVDVA